jgi:hypothetical protein
VRFDTTEVDDQGRHAQALVNPDAIDYVWDNPNMPLVVELHVRGGAVVEVLGEGENVALKLGTSPPRRRGTAGF